MPTKSINLNDSGVEFDDYHHTYTLNGTTLHGITGMLSRQLFRHKYIGVPDRILNEASERGKQIHTDLRVADILNTASTPLTEEYLQLLSDNNIEVITNEYIVSDLSYFASMVDKVVSINGDIFLLDVKNTSDLDKEYLSWQLSIYKYLFGIINPHIPIAGLKSLWTRHTLQLSDIPEKPQQEVIRLLQAERDGEQYTIKGEDRALSLIQRIADTIAIAEQAKSEQNALMDEVRTLMEQNAITQWDTDQFTIRLGEDYERTTFDTQLFRANHPDLFDKFTKTSVCKGRLTTKLK